MLAFFTPNCIDTPAVQLGAQWAGAIIAPANPNYTVGELEYQLRDSGAKALITQVAQLPVAREAAAKAGIPEDRIILIGTHRDPEQRFKHFTSVRNTSGATRYRKTKIDPKKDLAYLIYTSGTTGKSKGVMISHYNAVSTTILFWRFQGKYLSPSGGPDGKGDKILAFLPFYHIFGMLLVPLSTKPLMAPYTD